MGESKSSLQAGSSFATTGVDMQEEQWKLIEILRQELRLRNYSHKTFKAYGSCLRSFMKYFAPRHPRELKNEDIREYLLHLIERKKLSAATVNQASNAIRFLYVGLYKRPFTIVDIPRPEKEKKLPDVLSQDEVLKIFSHVDNLKHKTLLMLIYSAGLRGAATGYVSLVCYLSSKGLIYCWQVSYETEKVAKLIRNASTSE